MATPLQLAWLAGLWDGAGSVGINVTHGTALRSTIQLSMTHQPTFVRATEILRGLGCRALGYSYREAKAHQRAAHYLRVNRMNEQLIMASAVLPYAVTKYEHWVALIEFLERRLDGVQLDEQGRLPRGGSGQWWRPYTEEDRALAARFQALNFRARPGEEPLDGLAHPNPQG